jgi:hypothetical protein
MPFISQIWTLVLREEYLTDSFWTHIDQIEKKTKFLIKEKFGFDITINKEGKIFCNII